MTRERKPKPRIDGENPPPPPESRRPDPPPPPPEACAPTIDERPHRESIGRECRRGGHNLPASPYANPFVVGRDGTRGECVELYAARLCQAPADHIDQIRRELAGKILVCWCAPLACHGDPLTIVADGGAP